MFAFISTVQLALDSLDRLVDTLEERGTLSAVEAAQSLFNPHRSPTGSPARSWRKSRPGTVASSVRAPSPSPEAGPTRCSRRPTSSCSTWRRPGSRRLTAASASSAPSACGHSSWSARFSRSSIPASPSRSRSRLDRAASRSSSAPSVSSVLKRFRSFAGRTSSSPTTPASINASSNGNCSECTGGASRAAALHRSPGGCSTAGCAESASPRSPSSSASRRGPAIERRDAEATAEILVHLIGLAQELGARRLSDLRAGRAAEASGLRQALPGARRSHAAGRLPLSRPPRPGALRRPRPRPARPASLLLPQRAPATVGRGRSMRSIASSGGCSAQSSAALEELRLIRELQPPANSRSRRKEHGVYLKPRGDDFVVTKTATKLGPIASRHRASLAARALAMSTTEELETLELPDGGPLPRLRARPTTWPRASATRRRGCGTHRGARPGPRACAS